METNVKSKDFINPS